MEKIIVGIADYAVAHNPATLVTIGLGSCVGIALRDPKARIGALVHILLPSIKDSNNTNNPIKFADSAIEIVIQEMCKKEGVFKKRIEAKIAGGASMFNLGGASLNIGERNVKAVLQKLEQEKIPIIAKDTGGNFGRTVEFHIETGLLIVKRAFKEIKEI